MVPAHQDAPGEPAGELGALLTTIAAAVGRYEQASVDRRAPLQASVERSIDARLGEALGPVLVRLQHVEAALGELFALAERLEQRTAGLVGWFDELTMSVAAAQAGQAALEARVAEVAEQVAGVNVERLDALDERLTTTVGEATIARIELDRLGERVGERLDTVQVRIGELESQVAEQMDVSVAVQLERLDELERAVIDLHPDALARQV